jgi:hypothetical protein
MPPVPRATIRKKRDDGFPVQQVLRSVSATVE